MPTDPLYHDFDGGDPVLPVRFRAAGRDFLAAPAAPAAAMLKLVDFEMGSGLSTAQKVAAFGGFLDDVLLDESVVAFRDAMSDKIAPIDVNKMADVVAWLVEVYTGRPTEEPSPSGDGSETPGQSSTDGAPLKASTPPPSLLDDYSTSPTISG